jgi:restriction endonuclease S subunit
MLASVKRLRACGSGATFAEISKKQVAEFEIPLPELKVQRCISARLDKQMLALADIRASGEQQVQAADAARNALLVRLSDLPSANE